METEKLLAEIASKKEGAVTEVPELLTHKVANSDVKAFW